MVTRREQYRIYDEPRRQLGNVATGVTVKLPFTFYNRGNDTLKVASITSSGKEFAVTASRPNLAIAPGDSQAVTISCTPSTSGDFTGNITISSNDPDNKTLSIPVSGVGAPLTLSVDFNPADGRRFRPTSSFRSPAKEGYPRLTSTETGRSISTTFSCSPTHSGRMMRSSIWTETET